MLLLVSVISESEFIVSKLRESGKVSEDDIELIVSEFEHREKDPSSADPDNL